jgi:energy-coupling factor transporter ATP-binding protein EcfA2
MKLIKARVTNYRSVENSGDIDLDRMVCLVGKNEAGKTAVLQALAGLNPHPSTPIKFDKETDYPRRYLTEYAQRHPNSEAKVITTEWEIEDHERESIVAELGQEGLTDGPVILARAYGASEPEWQTPINYQKACDHLIEAERLTQQDKKAIGSYSNSDELRKALEGLTEKTPRQQALLDRLSKFPNKNIRGFVESKLAPGLPHFMYFSHYDRMAGQLRIDNLNDRKANGPKLETGETVFLDFLEFAGTSIEEITAATTYEGLNAKCEAASNNITGQLQDYWTQNPHLEIDVRVTKAEQNDPPPFNTGVIARARVRNNLHRVTVPFSERSAGFIWFFSFLVKFAQVRKSGGQLILLLDEPGLTLHGKAQEDLLRYFSDKLLPHHQVIFSTHSPFMVPADKMLSARIVEDRMRQEKSGRWTTDGTKVSSEVLATDPDTLFPLQGALGYEITQTLFVGKNTLLVEGPGDLLYLNALSSALKSKGRQILDRRWTICPAGGIDKIQSFVSLFAGAKLHVAAITDFAKSDAKKLDQLRKTKIIDAANLLTYADLLGKEEADVEDIFDLPVYVELLNASFSLNISNELTGEKLTAHSAATSRQLKQAELAFRLLSPDAPEFDHYTPAEWLIRNPSFFDGTSDGMIRTLANAEKVIVALNSLLPE